MLDLHKIYDGASASSVLSIRKLIGNIPKPQKDFKLMLAVVYGYVSGMAATEDERGPKVKFFGDFLAFSLDGGAVEKGEVPKFSMRAPAASLPPPVTDALVAAKIGHGRMATFGFRIGVVGDDSPIGYHYVTERFVGLDAFSPVERLIEQTAERLSQ